MNVTHDRAGEAIGVIGLGSMGGQVARRLVQQTGEIVVYDRQAALVEDLVELGATAATSPRHLAKRVSCVLTVVPDGPDVVEVYEGTDGILAGAHDGLLCLELSTIDPQVTRRVAAAAAARGMRVIDAAIGGQPELAAAGTLLFMVGGEARDVERARPVLALLGDRVVHCGEVGDGVTMKLVNNLLATSILSATCEALLIGKKAGLSVERMLAVMTGTAADSAQLRRVIPNRVAKRNFEPGFRLVLARKDVDLALALARRLDVPATFGAVGQQLRTVAVNRGLGDLDSSAIVQVMEDLAGLLLSDEEQRSPGGSIARTERSR